METAFYEESSLLTTNSKSSKSYDGNSMWLTDLCADGKLLDGASGRRDDLAFSDLADFLRSPDLGISSPDLESLVWKEWSDAVKTASPTHLSELPLIKQEGNHIGNITKEQEVFAFGFTEALKKLKDEEQQDCQGTDTQTEENDDDFSESSCDEDDTALEYEDSDTKLTFITYTFNSTERLPSFEEAFSKIISFHGKNQELKQLQIKSEKEDFEVPRKTAKMSLRNSSSSNVERRVIDSEQAFYWDKVETVDEGFCGREDTPVNYETGSANRSLSPALAARRREHVMFAEANRATIDKSSTQDLSNIIPKDFGDDEAFIGNNEIIDENFTHKQWLAMHSKLYNVEASPLESRFSGGTSDAMHGIAINSHDRFKSERKKNNNRFSALKSRSSRAIETSDSKNNMNKALGGICSENAKLIEELEIIRKKKECLAMPLMDASGGFPDV